MKKTMNTVILSGIIILTNIGFANAQLITTIAGNGLGGYNGDGIAATMAQLYSPAGIYMDPSGNIYIDDRSNNRVRKINTLGAISTFAGDGTGFSVTTGDGGQATSASVPYPTGICADAAGNIYISEGATNGFVRKVTTSGIISTVAGGGSSLGDGGAATNAQLNVPSGIFVDVGGNLLIADAADNRIRKVNTSGVISTIAGNGSGGFGGDGGVATAAFINNPSGLCIDAIGNIYFSDGNNQRIRKINTIGIISTVAGGGSSPCTNCPATSALMYPINVYTDVAGNLYLTDGEEESLFKVNSSGILTKIAGGGVSGGLGDGGLAYDATFSNPDGVCMDAGDNFYVCDGSHNRVRKICWPPLGAVTGPSTVCIDSSIVLSDTSTGGVWSASNGNATVSGGIVHGITPGADSIIYTAVPNSCGIPSTYNFLIVTDCTAGIKSIQQANDISVYPNPSNDNINIVSTVPIKNIAIINLFGQVVFAGSYNANSVVVSLEQLPVGVYIVKINGDKVYKVVKQ